MASPKGAPDGPREGKPLFFQDNKDIVSLASLSAVTQENGARRWEREKDKESHPT